MLCLGIESTAHSYAVGIVDEKCSILANEKHAVITEEGGLIPRELAEHHLKYAKPVIENALKKARVQLKDIDLIAFSQGPGIGSALTVGAVAARALSLAHGIPLIGVNHCVAHIEIGRKLTGAKNPLVVYVSGANSQIIGFESGKYRVYGETLDIGLGNLLDNFGRAMGLGFPAGPKLDEMYFNAKKLVELPYSVKGMDLVFSGLLTAAEQKIGKANETDLAYSLMHTALAMVSEVSERALAHTEKKELLLVGGVAASRALREMLQEMCKGQKAKFFVPPFGVCIDNGLMIAWQGLLEHVHGKRMALEETEINQRFRTDQVQVNWMK
ncbi:MAG: bifunctional N(6)-L-threonylcarbamoyladenine synthase/serine/threonine protein kinase [Candidatus Diapherotrites archaeon]